MKAPFPWFGGKRRVAPEVWARFGDVANYVEPFFGSGAVLLDRPHEPRTETINDLDCYVANFWRAVSRDLDGLVAAAADWPVNEADLHARHNWLVNSEHCAEFRERMKTQPEYFDLVIAGWWVWGISQWIGPGWCSRPDWRPRPGLTGVSGVHNKRPHLGNRGRGVSTPPRQIPQVGGTGRGVHRPPPPTRQKPLLSSSGMGIHVGSYRKPEAENRGIVSVGVRIGALYDYFLDLQSRLRRVRVCCGDWARVVTPSVTECNGLTAVMFDPPYASERDADLYAQDSMTVAHDVRKWAVENGDNPMLRIALCGYEGEHDMPSSWSTFEWKAVGGYANQSSDGTRGRENAKKERIWFSPHCLPEVEAQPTLFDFEEAA